MLRSILRLAVVYIAFYITAMVPSFAAQRVALVLGNSNYESVGLLRNPANDATALAEALKRLQFSVTLAMDLDKSSFESALADFSEASSGAEIALIYYAGHAIEMNGQNFLIPTDAKLTSDSRVAFETVSLDDLLNAVGDTRGLKMIILDSCRNNPFVATMKRKAGGRAVGRGLIDQLRQQGRQGIQHGALVLPRLGGQFVHDAGIQHGAELARADGQVLTRAHP